MIFAFIHFCLAIVIYKSTVLSKRDSYQLMIESTIFRKHQYFGNKNVRQITIHPIITCSSELVFSAKSLWKSLLHVVFKLIGSQPIILTTCQRLFHKLFALKNQLWGTCYNGVYIITIFVNLNRQISGRYA